jgi:ATP-dependent DNA ligase
MSLLSLGAVQPPTYPARPMNGGRLELAPPKPGQWWYEPKYNGWRALVHAPSGSMFNRYGQPLSIAAEFGRALKHLRDLKLMAGGIAIEWFDCEALDRRHALSRGTLLAFDYIAPPESPGEPLYKRKELLAQALAAHEYRQVPLAEALYAVGAHDPGELNPQELYRQLRQLNARWRCQFYEGLVAKRSTDVYPVQLRSPNAEFVGWIKHRWAGSS